MLDNEAVKALTIANGTLLFVEVLHDLDHIRQTVYLCLTASPLVWTILAFGFVPSIVALVMARRRIRYAAHLTLLTSMALSATLLTIHLVGGPAFFGGFALPYTKLKVDGLTWAMLWLLLLACLYAAAVSFNVIYRSRGAVRA